jgi:hypothetical protein
MSAEIEKFIDESLINPFSKTKYEIRLCKDAEGYKENMTDYLKWRLSEPVIEDTARNKIEKEKIDTLFFTQEEKELIASSLAVSKEGFWKKLRFENINLFSKKKFKRQQKTKKKRLKGGRYWFYSQPIFLRNEQYCCIYQRYDCGPLCGAGYLDVYKKVEGKWTIFRFIQLWIS